MRSNQAKFSDLVNADVSKSTGKKRQKSTQRRKGMKEVKENPVMYCSGVTQIKSPWLIHVKVILLHLLLHHLKQIKLKVLTLSSHGK